MRGPLYRYCIKRYKYGTPEGNEEIIKEGSFYSLDTCRTLIDQYMRSDQNNDFAYSLEIMDAEDR